MVIVLGLLSALSWGSGDFAGGLVSRRAPVAGVLLGSQVAGGVVAVLVAVGLGEHVPSLVDAGWALLSSVIGGIGIASLYIGLSRGRMGVVAPVAGVLVAAIPAIAGIALQGQLPTQVLVGIGLAMASVVVVSRVGAADEGRASGAAWGVAAGLALGVVAVTLSRFTAGEVFAPLAIMRFGEATLIAIVLLSARGRIRAAVPGRLLVAVSIVGALDMLGTATFIAATQAGPLAVAGVLSALYPVTTVVLAVTILREPLARWHLVGILVAIASIVLITTGSTA
jgi:drug/metabolite transporter (DMT)-like permease